MRKKSGLIFAAFIVLTLALMPGLFFSYPVCAGEEEHPFVTAIKKGEIKTVEKLLAEGYQIDETYKTADKGYLCPLALAAANNQSRIVELLLTRNASLDIKDCPNERTVLHYAAENGHTEMVQLLIERGAKADEPDLLGTTPLHLAAANNHVNVVELLCRHGARFNSRTKAQESALHLAGGVETAKWLVDHGINIHDKTLTGRTPLFFAKTPEMAQLLLEKGAFVNAIDNNKLSPLDAALESNRPDVAKFLESRGGASNVLSDSILAARQMNEAVRKGYLSVVQYYIDHGVNINAQDENGETCLFKTTTIETARFLVDKGASVTVTSKKGLTPLHIAVQYADLDTVKFYVEKGANVNATTDDGSTPLVVAVRGSETDIASYLVSQKANVNVRVKKDQQTPLHIAVNRGKIGMVTILVKAGADVNATDVKGNSPLFYAQKRKKKVIASFLRQHGAVHPIGSDTLTVFVLISCLAGAVVVGKIPRKKRGTDKSQALPQGETEKEEAEQDESEDEPEKTEDKIVNAEDAVKE